MWTVCSDLADNAEIIIKMYACERHSLHPTAAHGIWEINVMLAMVHYVLQQIHWKCTLAIQSCTLGQDKGWNLGLNKQIVSPVTWLLEECGFSLICVYFLEILLWLPSSRPTHPSVSFFPLHRPKLLNSLTQFKQMLKSLVHIINSGQHREEI